MAQNSLTLKDLPPKLRSCLRSSSSLGPREESRPTPGSTDEAASAFPLVGSSTDETRRRRLQVTQSILCVASVVGAMVLALSLMLKIPRTARSAISPCLSPSCRLYVRSLEASMDSGRDPCVDFYAFVCARWKPVTDNGNRKLTIIPTFLGVDLDALLAEHQYEDEHAHRACLLFHALEGQSQTESALFRERQCQQLAKLQSDVFRRLSNHSERRWVTYASVYEFAANATPDISGEFWVRLINNHAQVGSHVLSSSEVEVYDPGYIREFATILREKPKKGLLSLFGLTFVEVLGRAVTELAPFIYSGREQLAWKRHTVYCYRLTDVALPGALGSHPATYLYHQYRTKKIEEVSHVVLASVSEKLRQSSWLGGESKTVIKHLLEAPIFIEGLERKMNAEKHEFPTVTRSFLRNIPLLPGDVWVKFHRRFHYSGGDVDWTDPWQLANAKNGRLRLVVPDVYMLQSVFPDDAFESVNYATIGSLIARQATVALMTTVDNGGRELTWPTPKERLIRQAAIDCLIEAFEARYNSTQGKTTVDPSALYVAWKSLSPLFTALHSSAGFPEWSVGFHHYTPQQLFFIALCFSVCRQGEQATSESSGAAWCNFLLSMFRPFANSFHCPEGWPMHPAAYCSEH
ncbi:hypothetical protein V5799_006192 [Amblyomma americanum]|uniref:M13 family peptidase n=1 Tax=Amblyomma americanum TaxID=6943 RepID=A0AAQ4DX38_AMBAM